MSDHTPGPWKWWTSNSWRRLRRDHPRDERHVLEPYKSQHDGHPDCIVSEADMALIAAAPDLYEALLEARERMMGSNPAIKALIIKTDAALAKARGEVSAPDIQRGG